MTPGPGPTEPEADIVIVFDGGSLGNPGRGYGSFRLRQRGGDWSDPVGIEFGPRLTNNEAEYRALIAALEAARALSSGSRRPTLEVRGDSQLVLNHLRGTWKVRAANLRPLYAQARGLLTGFSAARLVWQPRDRSVELLGH